MDTFTAIPSIVRLPISVIDKTRYDEWLASDDLDSTPPTITQIYVGYSKGAGCPVPVQIEVDGIETEYEAQIPTPEERGENSSLSINELVDKWRRANFLLRRNLLLAVIKNLDPDDANVLANEAGGGREILIKLGWVSAPEEEQQITVENKEEGEDETGESISSISPQSTQE